MIKAFFQEIYKSIVRDMNKKPNFFIVGAAKSGTTSLYHYLNQHPEIYMCPIKEPNFHSKDFIISEFNENYKKRIELDLKKYLKEKKLPPKHSAHIKRLNEYLELFREVKNEKAIGEISNGYLYSKVAAKNIYEFDKNAKIIIILRDPVKRAFSGWLMELRLAAESEKDFITAVIKDYKKKKKGWGISYNYIEGGLYYEQVKRYFDVFPKDQIKIIIFEKMVQNMRDVIGGILKFLNVNINFKIDISEKYNVKELPRFPIINQFIDKIISFKCIKIKLEYYTQFLNKNFKCYKNILFSKKGLPSLSKSDIKYLIPFFKEDIEKLSELVKYDFSDWIKP